MARNPNSQTTNAASPKAPHFLAWHITEKGEKSFWNRIGAAWQHKDGGGFTVQLEVLPIGGRIVLRQPLDDSSETAKQEQGA